MSTNEYRNQPAVPQGWKLVPIEPTKEMLSAALRDCSGIGGGSCGEHTGVDGEDFSFVWGTMLAAAPSAPSQEPVTCGNGCSCLVQCGDTYAHAGLPIPREPVTLTDEYAGVIAWIGDKQCKLLVTEDAIKHEHTPGVAMRNAAHQCVQEVIIAALREKEAKATP